EPADQLIAYGGIRVVAFLLPRLEARAGNEHTAFGQRVSVPEERFVAAQPKPLVQCDDPAFGTRRGHAGKRETPPRTAVAFQLPQQLIGPGESGGSSVHHLDHTWPEEQL